MKIEKKKIVFMVVIGAVLTFIIGYATLVLGDKDDSQQELTQPTVPKLETLQEGYTSRLDAVNDLKEVRQTNAPSVYDEKLLDSTGLFDPDLIEKQKARIVDSIYNNGRIDYSTMAYRNPTGNSMTKPIIEKKEKKALGEPPEPTLKEMALRQQLFFASDPEPNETLLDNLVIHAIVKGQQVIKVNDRLRMRITEDIVLGDNFVPKNTLIYGIVRFKPNRVLLTIENIDHNPIALKAFDLQDGLEGLYIKNTFRAEATREVVSDAINDINVPGLPQVRGLKNIFRRSNRQVKVTVNSNYELILVDNRH